jgi:hypothetical protein
MYQSSKRKRFLRPAVQDLNLGLIRLLRQLLKMLHSYSRYWLLFLLCGTVFFLLQRSIFLAPQNVICTGTGTHMINKYRAVRVSWGIFARIARITSISQCCGSETVDPKSGSKVRIQRIIPEPAKYFVTTRIRSFNTEIMYLPNNELTYARLLDALQEGLEWGLLIVERGGRGAGRPLPAPVQPLLQVIPAGAVHFHLQRRLTLFDWWTTHKFAQDYFIVHGKPGT